MRSAPLAAPEWSPRTAITERFTWRANGHLEVLTPGSTKPIAMITTHAGVSAASKASDYLILATSIPAF